MSEVWIQFGNGHLYKKAEELGLSDVRASKPTRRVELTIVPAESKALIAPIQEGASDERNDHLE